MRRTIRHIPRAPPVLTMGPSSSIRGDGGPWQNWISTLTTSLALQAQPAHPFHGDPYALRSITVDSHSMFGPRIGFLKLTAHVATADGASRLPGVIFLRGPAVAMLVVLVPDDVPGGGDDGEAYVILTVQPRIATGSLGFVELPAGMLDGSSNFAGTAAREIEEELGLVIPQDELTCLTDRAAEVRRTRGGGRGGGAGGSDKSAQQESLPYAMFPSAGGCDEYIKIFAHERRVPRDTLRAWEGKYGGLRDQGEMITLKIVPLEDLWLEGGMDAKALAAVTLYKQLRKLDQGQK